MCYTNYIPSNMLKSFDLKIFAGGGDAEGGVGNTAQRARVDQQVGEGGKAAEWGEAGHAEGAGEGGRPLRGGATTPGTAHLKEGFLIRRGWGKILI